MRMHRFLSTAMCLLLLILNACTRLSPVIHDTIPVLRLQSGSLKTIDLQDLFTADHYQMQFEPHQHIRIKHDTTSTQVQLTPDEAFCGLTSINFSYENRLYTIPVFIEKLQTITFTFKPGRIVSQITVFGSFNSWNRQELHMTDPDGDGLYKTMLSLEPGRYEYKFYVDGEELIDNTNPDRVPNPFGDFNSLLTVRSTQVSRSVLHTLNYKMTCEGLVLSFRLDGYDKQPAKDDIFAMLGNSLLEKERIGLEGNRIDVTLPHNCTDMLRLAVTHEGTSTPMHNVPLRDGEIAGRETHAFEWQDAVIYAIMVDRFLDGDPANTHRADHPELHVKANFHGGDLQGILTKLEEGYFDSLGINILWLSPVIRNTHEVFREYPAPHRFYSAYHGYWPVHHRDIDERFGTMRLFKRLVKTAHAHGIRVLLDYVANHVHQDHSFYQQHPEWFGTLELPDGRKNIRFWDEYRLTTWFEPFLPSFDYINSPEALKAITDNAVWWVKETGIDGFRQDAVKHIPNLFWRTLTRKLKGQIKRPLFQIGETFGSYDLISSYVNNGQLDSQFNFNLYETALQTFLSSDGSFDQLDEEMMKTFSVYGVNHLMGNLMDSHDKTRYMALADGDITLGNAMSAEIGFTHPPSVDHPESFQKALLYLTYMMTIPGTPVIYYGDEIGMSGAPDPDNRRPMRFNGGLSDLERAHLPRFQRIVRLRSRYSALRYGDFNTLLADKDLYAYMRSDFHGRVLVLLNKSNRIRTVTLNLPKSIITEAYDCMASESVTVRKNQITLTVDPIGWRIIIL